METESQVQPSSSKVQEKGMPATYRDISYLIIALLIGAVAYAQHLYEKSTEELLASTTRGASAVLIMEHDYPIENNTPQTKGDESGV